VLGLGGYGLANGGAEQEAVRIVHEAIDAGLTFMDNAWKYQEGRSEEWMGKALQGRRQKVFLMTKLCTPRRDRRAAMQQLEDSLPVSCRSTHSMPPSAASNSRRCRNWTGGSIAAIGMKSLSGGGDAVKKGIVTVGEALRYAMSLPSSSREGAGWEASCYTYRPKLFFESLAACRTASLAFSTLHPCQKIHA
jgi:hypothetical protein